jgi:hypothetical protein
MDHHSAGSENSVPATGMKPEVRRDGKQIPLFNLLVNFTCQIAATGG